MENERDAAFKKWLKVSVFVPYGREIQAWKAGYDARQPGWVEIRTADDLPKESGEYIWQLRDGRVGCGSFHPKLHVDEMLENHVAWHSLPEPFSPDTHKQEIQEKTDAI